MKYSCELNIFLKSNETSIKDKISKLDTLSVEDLLALLRNIEENHSSYDEEVIKAVVHVLMTKNIICL